MLHLKTLFDNIVKIDLQDLDILAMQSNEGERVPFSKPAKKRGAVESWLDQLE